MQPSDHFALLAIGGAHVDRIGHVGAHYVAGASNPGRLVTTVGGGALNAARNAVMRGVGRTGLISARGGDHDGAIVGETIEGASIEDLSAVFLDRRTASYTAILDDTGEQIAGLADMEIYESALPRQLRRKALREAISSAAALLVDANLPVSALVRTAALASAPIFAVAISPAKAPRLTAVAGRLACVFMNRREMNALTGTEDAHGLSALRHLDFTRAVVTGGAGPVLVLDGAHALAVDPPPVDAVADVTGAGDALAGATIAALLAGPRRPLAEAVRDGVAAAQLTIATHGPVADGLTGPVFDTIRERTTIRPLDIDTGSAPT